MRKPPLSSSITNIFLPEKLPTSKIPQGLHLFPEKVITSNEEFRVRRPYCTRLEKVNLGKNYKFGENYKKKNFIYEIANYLKEINNVNIGPRAYKGLEILKNLKILARTLFNINDLSSKQALMQFLKCSTNLKSLTSVQINFGALWDFEVEALKSIFNALDFLRHLSLLHLVFDKPTITDEKIQYISAHLNKFTHLKSLSLGILTEANVTDQAIEYLTEALRGIPQLLCLSLQIDKPLFTSRLFFLIKKGLNSLLALKKLQLGFSYTSNAGPNNISSLSKSFRKLTNLRALELLLENGGGTNDATVRHLLRSNNIRRLINLDHLNLSFKDCTQITNEGVAWVSQILRRFKSLKTLNLSFEGINEIEETGMEPLARAIARLQLESLTLNFSSCHDMSDEALNQLLNYFYKLDNLKSLNLQFISCPITERSLIFLFKELKKLTQLKFLELSFEKNPTTEMYIEEINIEKDMHENMRENNLIQILRDALEELKHLRTLELTLIEYDLNKSDLRNLAATLSRLPDLEGLRFMLDNVYVDAKIKSLVPRALELLRKTSEKVNES